MRTGVKICGLMTPQDARRTRRLGADFAGLVFAPGRHRLDIPRAREILEALGPVQSVGVLVDLDLAEARTLRRELGLDILQLHGEESLPYLESLGGRLWKAVPPDTPPATAREILRVAEMLLADAGDSHQRGGTGRTFEWSGLSLGPLRDRLVLAGGLHSGNVRRALETVGPAVVDVSSGVETGGEKDPRKIEQFIREVRTWIP